MKDKHIPFSKLSDLYDNRIISGSEKQLLLDHIKECDLCRGEYDRLIKTIEVVSKLRIGIKNRESFITNTITEIKQKRFRHKRYSVRRYAPLSAIAASLIVIIGIVLFSEGKLFFQKGSITKHISVKKGYVDYFDYIDLKNSSSVFYRNIGVVEALSVLKRYNAKVYNVSDSHIEGEISLADYENLVNATNNPARSSRFIKSVSSSRVAEQETEPMYTRYDWTNLEERDKIIYFKYNVK